MLPIAARLYRALLLLLRFLRSLAFPHIYYSRVILSSSLVVVLIMDHVVVFPLNFQGHLIPSLMLAHNLATLKTKLLVTMVVFEHRMQKIHTQARLRGCSSRINFAALKSCSPPPHLLCSSGHDSYELMDWVLKHLGHEDSAGARQEIKMLLSGIIQQGDGKLCIVNDAFSFAWVQDVANELGIPKVTMYPGPAENLVFDLYLRVLHMQGALPIRTSLKPENGIKREELDPIYIPGIHPIHPDDVSNLVQDNNDPNVVDAFVKIILRHHEAAGIICNTFQALEPEACAAASSKEVNFKELPFMPVGPLLVDSYFSDEVPRQKMNTQEGKEEECIMWLNRQPEKSVVYISFGSFAKPSAAQVREIALAIDDSGYCFLWVLHALDGKGSSSDPFEALPEGFLERVQGRKGFVTKRFAPQLRILSHFATAVFFTHAGWNSTLESISSGVPMVCMPFWADQRMICRMVVDRLKVGTDFKNVSKEHIERAVKAVMGDDQMKLRAKELKTYAKESFKSSHDKLETFILGIMHNF